MLVPGLAARPVGGQWTLAIGTLDTAAQGEVRTDIRARGCVALTFQPRLNLFEGGKINQAFMLAFAQRHIPFGVLDHASVYDAVQNTVDGFVRHGAVPRLGKIRLAFEITFHFCLRMKAARGIAFHGFLYDRSQRLIAHQNFAVPFTLFVAQANAWNERIIALPYACFHTVAGLLGVLDAVMLGDRGQQMFNKLAVAVLAKFNGRAFKKAARA